MSTVSLRSTTGRALLLAPPDWARVLRFALTSWLLAAGGIWAAQQLHTTSHETLELTPAVHLLRDASLAVPMAAASLAIAGLIASEALHRVDRAPASVAGRVTWAIVAALVFAVLSIPGQDVHAWLFGAEQETGSWVVDVALDSSVVLAAAIPILLGLALLRLTPWPPSDTAEVPEQVLDQRARAPHSPVSAIERPGTQGASRHA